MEPMTIKLTSPPPNDNISTIGHESEIKKKAHVSIVKLKHSRNLCHEVFKDTIILYY